MDDHRITDPRIPGLRSSAHWLRMMVLALPLVAVAAVATGGGHERTEPYDTDPRPGWERNWNLVGYDDADVFDDDSDFGDD